MAVPYTFAGATSSIPLSQLDTNFASTITLGNTAIQLGNTVTTLNNMTLANVTISSGNVTITNVTVTTANVTVGNITTLTGTSATYTNIASGNVTITGGTLNNVAIGGTTAASGAFTTLSASGAFSLTGDQVQISEGGTGQTTANAAFNALAPSQTGNSGKYLKTDGTDTSWDAIDINTADITGTLPILNGGTGQTTANAAFNALAPSQTSQSGKYLKTDGTNASWDALDISTADITGTLPIANGGTGLTALGTGVQTALGQNVTGSGGIVLATSPVLTTPNLGTPSAATLTNATGLPISTGVSGLGTNVATALAVNVGTAGAFVVNGGALGTPSGGTLTNCTGYPTSALSGSINLATQVTGTLATTNGGTGLTSFTANGVVYASSTSALTTGSALTFDGTWLGVTGGFRSFNAAAGGPVDSIYTGTTAGAVLGQFRAYGTGAGVTAESTFRTVLDSGSITSANFQWLLNNSEQMRLTSTGLAVGLSGNSPAQRLHVGGNQILQNLGSAIANNWIRWQNSSGTFQAGIASYFNVADTGNIEFLNGSTTNMVLSSSGNLGIGTPSPQDKLHVAATGTNAGAGYFVSRFQDSTSTKGVFLGYDTDELAGTIYGVNFLTFQTYNGSAWGERMRLDASGNLGIGTSSPATKLDVVGALNLQGSSTFPTTGMFLRSADNQLKIIGGSAGISFAAQSGASTYAVIDSSGNLGLGVTPSAWRSTTRALQIGSTSSFQNFDNGGTIAVSMGNNFYWNSSDQAIYIQSKAASNYYQAGGQHVWASAPSGTAGNAITGANAFVQVLAVDRAKSLSLEGATPQSGTGITFPATQNASSDANTLDDYEEGTWTPAVRGAVTAGTYELSVAEGSYVKIGKQVTLSCRIVFAAAITGGGTSYLQITGAPSFNNAAAAYGPVSQSGLDMTTNYTWLTASFINTSGTTILYLDENGDSVNSSDFPISGVSANDSIRFSITYIST